MTSERIDNMIMKEIVYDIKNIIRGGAQSDDEIISDRQVEFQVKRYPYLGMLRVKV